MRILGIDPGNYSTGYCVMEAEGNSFQILTSGSIKSKKRPSNLVKIYTTLEKLLEEYKPQEIALEGAFYGKNPQSLIRLGEVRGVILLLSGKYNIPLFEYTPQKVKNSITGYGWSKKEDVSVMVERILGVKPQDFDEADAVAVSFCHLLSRRVNIG
ncbi:MAG: crossover junction endodeoxyribonuclease RuvC [Aquificae bacterium]|nr:crossover junction endodeoxyribonuclease RuvC [Aquificota bacterium]